MSIVVLRSVCCGVAAAVISVPAYLAAGAWYVERSLPPAVRENSVMGFDVSITHPPLVFVVWLVVAFAIGFLLGWRVFSKRRSPPQTL